MDKSKCRFVNSFFIMYSNMANRCMTLKLAWKFDIANRLHYTSTNHEQLDNETPYGRLANPYPHLL